MVMHIVLRNIQRNLNRNKPIYLILLFSFSTLLILNSIVFSISNSYRTLYTNYFTSDLAISANEEDFTIFGSSLLFVGNLIFPSIINNIHQVVEILNNEDSINGWTGLLTIPVGLKVRDDSTSNIAFGVNFDSYFNIFPDLELVAGSFPISNSEQPQIMIQQSQYEALGYPDIGSEINVISSDEFEFRFRRVTLSGIYSYPSDDELLKTVVLVDANIVRSLAGYVSEPRQLIDISNTEQEFISTDIDDLFSINSNTTITDEAELEISEIEELLSLSQERQVARTVVESTWHFILINSNDNYSFSESRRILENYGITAENTYKISNWRDSAGGNAELIYFLSLLINFGTGILILGTILVILNSLMLSILERSWEIATMRAIGASKLVIIKLISAEVIITIIVISFFGIFLGILGIGLINSFNIIPTNDFLVILLGNTSLQGIISVPLILSHFGFGLLLAGLCTVYPLIRVLRIPPRQSLL